MVRCCGLRPSPGCTPAPTRHGFGTSLVKATFKDARFVYAADGLCCEIDVLLGRADPAAADAGPEALAIGGSET